MPADRSQRLLRSLLKHRREVLRYLLLLLSESGAQDSDAGGSLESLTMGVAGAADAHAGVPLFEALVRTLDRDPHAWTPSSRTGSVLALLHVPRWARLCPWPGPCV